MVEERKIEDLSPEELKEFQRLYNASQICAIQLMIKMGVIANEQEYVDEIAPVFHMLIMGIIRVKPVDWRDVREQVAALMQDHPQAPAAPNQRKMP